MAIVLLGLGYVGFRLRPSASLRAVPDDDVVATVAGRSITLGDLRSELERRARRGAAAEPGAVLEDLIRRESLVARARELGLAEDPEVVLAWKRLLIAELKKRELEPRLASLTNEAAGTPGTAVAGDAFEGAPRSVSQVRVAWLRQEFHARTSATKRRQMQASLEEARRRATTLDPEVSDFGALSVEFSDDPATRYQGGDLGWLTEAGAGSNLDPRVVEAVRALRGVGDVSPIIEGQGGYYLLRLTGRREVERSARHSFAGAGGRSETADFARFAAQRQARELQERAFEDELRARAGVVIHPDWQARLPLAAPPASMLSGGARRDLFP